MSSELLCKDCKHSFRTINSWLTLGSSHYAYSCRKNHVPAHQVSDPVIGMKKIPEKYEGCSISRMSRLTKDINENHCGPEGKLWEPKHKKFLFLAVKYSERQQ